MAKQKIRNAKKRIEEKGYHISVGMESMKNKPFIYEMVKQAERLSLIHICIWDRTADILSESMTEDIYVKLKMLTDVDQAVRAAHIDRINIIPILLFILLFSFLVEIRF